MALLFAVIVSVGAAVSQAGVTPATGPVTAMVGAEEASPDTTEPPGPTSSTGGASSATSAASPAGAPATTPTESQSGGPATTTTVVPAQGDGEQAPTTARPPTTGQPPTTAQSPATAQTPAFETRVTTIDKALEKELRDTKMWSEEVPIRLDELRVLHVSYWDFDGEVRQGRLIVNHAWALRLGKVFHKLFDARFPIRRMDPVDYLGMNGEGLVASDNTMSFNGRKMRGGSSWSMHAYGLALDIDPAENPYVKGDMIIPALGAAYVDRTELRPGMLRSGDVVVEAFKAIGWRWGGDWTRPKDYMHFSVNGK